MSTSLFSLSAPVRLLLALVLIVVLGLAVRWAVALP
ncbi:Uncharacterised protein [Enterobacter cloacae]|nr:Uncharacterised protein [Enterobacter cloacae]